MFPERLIDLRLASKLLGDMDLSFLYLMFLRGGGCVIIWRSAWMKWWSESIWPLLGCEIRLEFLSVIIRSMLWFERWVEKSTKFLRFSESRKSLNKIVSGASGESMWTLKSPMSINSPWSFSIFPLLFWKDALRNLAYWCLGICISHIGLCFWS